MLDKLKDWDTQLFLYLNSLHTPWLDEVMYWVTDRYFWIPLYAIIIVLVYRRYGLPGFWIILATVLAVSLADQFTSSFMKPYFGRLRPCYESAIQKLVYILRGCGGQYGFASSHASTTFALATSMWLFVRPAFRYAWALFIWAAIVSYSRIYVGVHYPTDLLIGGLAGSSIAWIVYVLYQLILHRINYCIVPLSRENKDNLLNQ